MPKETETFSSEGGASLHTVMIVEDDVHIGAFLVEAITEETPYHALLVGSSAEALERLKSLKPNLLILDYHLPGIDGLRLYDKVHEIPEMQEIPAIMMSARLPQRELQKRSIVGINKPFDLDDFLQKVTELLKA
ncbi:MAG TPA: response regulator [Ktedonobacteraceae bacterium]|nr:response regulator [Ktedonobacteraceae bacterium]